MKSIFCCILTAIFLSCSVTAKAAGPIQYPPLIIEEEDGSPSVKGASKLKVTNGTLTRSGVVVTLDLSGAGGGVGFGLTDPNADRIYFWDDGAGANAFLTPGNSIAITGTTLDTIQDIRTTSTPQFARLGLGAAADATNILTATSASTTDLSKAINVTHTGAITGTGYGGYFSKTGASTTNVGLYATASGATNNYAAIFEAGNVGIGTTSPGYTLDIAGQTRFTTRNGSANALVIDFTPSTYNPRINGPQDADLSIARNGSDRIKFLNGWNEFLGTQYINGNVGIGTETPGTDIVGTYDWTAGTVLQVDGGGQPNVIIRGDTSAILSLIDTGAATNEKWVRWYNESGNTKFQIMNDVGTTVSVDAVTIDNTNGNVGIGMTTGFGTSAVGVVSLGEGTAPTTSPANVTQAWTADWNGAGTNALFIRTEEGTQHVFGSSVGIGHITPDRLLHPEIADATTAAVSYAQRLSHVVSTASTGSSNGFGVGLEFELETGTDLTNQISGTIESLWATAANATRKGRLNLYAYDTAARLGLTVEASGAAAMLGFFGVGAVVRPTALTTQLTSITHTSPGTPDYALQNLVQNTGFGFLTADEGNTFLSVVLNLQTRISELETKLIALGLLQ